MKNILGVSGACMRFTDITLTLVLDAGAVLVDFEFKTKTNKQKERKKRWAQAHKSYENS
jgi:hypothetical protein